VAVAVLRWVVVKALPPPVLQPASPHFRVNMNCSILKAKITVSQNGSYMQPSTVNFVQ